MPPAPPPLALTLGDPAGIGPDITLGAFAARLAEAIPPFVLIGDPEVIAARAAALGMSVPLAIVDSPDEVCARFAEALPILPVAVAGTVTPGKPDQEAAPAVRESIERAVALVRQGAVAGIVTNPISKAALYRAGFAFPGHTEFLGALAGEAKAAPVMMLVGPDLKVVPVTIHIPLKDVTRALTEELILATIETAAAGLQRFFGLPRPRLVLCGLNPHAGEEGSLGREELDIIAPAIARARRKGLNVEGPFSADTLFHARARESYDVALAMYHDQALIPIKTLAFDVGVNVTLGLPFVRTSPDHGTAFGLAGTGKAKAASLIEALRLAARMSRQARLGT